MSLTITVRPARNEDVATIFSFINTLEETDFDFLIFQEFYQQNISGKDNIYLVAVDANQQVVGYLSCHGQVLLHHLGKVFEIQEMFVDEQYRSRGIGALLIQSLTAILEQQDYKMLEVTTNIKRTATQEFYRRNGFQQTHLKFTKPNNI